MGEHERAARKHRKRMSTLRRGGNNSAMMPSGSAVDVLSQSKAAQSGEAPPLDILWTDGFIHGQILFARKQTLKLFSKMKQMVQESTVDRKPLPISLPATNAAKESQNVLS